MSGRSLRTSGAQSPALRFRCSRNASRRARRRRDKHRPVARHQPRIAARASFGTRRGKTRHGALADQRPLELGHRAQDLQRETALRRRRVDRITQRPEMYAPILQGGDRLEQVQQGPAKAVEPDDDKRVAAGQTVEKVGQDRM